MHVLNTKRMHVLNTMRRTLPQRMLTTELT